MKADFERYLPNQVVLLKDGTFLMVTSVDPKTRMNSSESSRRCYCKVGHKYKKNENMKCDTIVVFENEPEGTVISIDCAKNLNLTIEELREKEAHIVGVVTEEKMKDFNRILGDYSKNEKW